MSLKVSSFLLWSGINFLVLATGLEKHSRLNCSICKYREVWLKMRTGLLLGTVAGRGRYEGEFSQIHPEGSRLNGASRLNWSGEERDGGEQERKGRGRERSHRPRDTTKVYSRND